ncbi:MAG TPA: amidase [Ktedonobacteraceae bacterium]|jgi:fatty acid amide hydrolase
MRANAALTRLSATELAALLARGDVSSLEAVQAHIARIEEVNPRLNAVVVKRYTQACAEAKAADERLARGETPGPLHGVPLTIKESLDLAGTPTTSGLPSRAGVLAEHDDPYVAAVRAAGAIIVGKTNVSQLLLYTESDNPVYGRTNNPWNLERSCGGSSGGQAAIIAAGGSPLGLGTDIGGSLRYPATFCGVASLKPTAGRTPDQGRYSIPIGQRAIVSQVGVLARQVEDVALGLRVLAEDPATPAEAPVPLGDPRTVDVSRLRVGYYIEDGTFGVAPAVRRAVLLSADLIGGCGARVTAWAPPAVTQAQDLFFRVLSADGARGIKRLLGRDKRDPRIVTLELLAARSRPTLFILDHLLRAAGQFQLASSLHNFGYRDTDHYWQLVEDQLDYRQRFQRALDQADGGPFDIVLCPACALPAFTHGSARDLVTAGAYAHLYNVLGYPAGVVPLTRVRPGEDSGRPPSRDIVEKTARRVELGSAGLPVGVQVVARPWQEHVALAVMGALEAAACKREGYPQLPPPVAGQGAAIASPRI